MGKMQFDLLNGMPSEALHKEEGVLTSTNQQSIRYLNILSKNLVHCKGEFFRKAA